MHTRRSRWARLTAAAALVVTMVGTVSAPAPAAAAASRPRDTSRFACPADLPDPFTDIAGSVHATAIRCMARYGFINGTTSTTFSPGSNVTRGQLASFLARTIAFSGFPLDTTDQGFTDVSGSVHRDAINALATLGVVKGTSATTFEPNRAVTRAQGASMVARLLEVGVVLDPGPDAFEDDDGSVHEPSINALAALGIVGGVTSDTFRPSANVTRGAAASIVARAQDFAVESSLNDPVGDLDVLLASLRGAVEVPGPGDNAAAGTAELTRGEVDGLLCVTWDIDAGFTAALTAAHIHKAAAGSAGPIVITLPAPDVGAGERTFERSCIADVDQGLIDAVFLDPAGHYVNVHTTAFPDGAIRGQLGSVATPLGTMLSGDEEAPLPGETMVVEGDILVPAEGDATVDVLSDGTTICAFVFYGGANTPTAAHIHKAAPGAAGPVVVTLAPFDEDAPFSDGCIGGLAPAVVADIAANPDDYYVNVHTNLHTDGAVRGQLAARVLLAANLTGGATGDPDGAGEALLDLIGDGVACVRITVRGIGTPTSAHIHHQGAPLLVVAPLPRPTFNTAFGCIELSSTTFDAIVANPAAHSVDVHTTVFADGAVRGSLAPAPP